MIIENGKDIPSSVMALSTSPQYTVLTMTFKIQSTLGLQNVILLVLLLFIIGHVRKIKILKFISEIQGSSINPSDSIIVINIAINNDAAHCRLGIVYGVRGKRVITIFSVCLFRGSSGCFLRVPFSIEQFSHIFFVFTSENAYYIA